MEIEYIKDIVIKINNSYSNIIGVTINAIILLLTFIFGIRQLTQIKKSRYAETLTTIFEEIHSQATISDRDRFFSTDLNNFETLSMETQVLSERLIDMHNRIAYYACRNIIPRKYIIEMYSGLYVKMWEFSKEYIIQKRKYSGLLNYAIYFEQMYHYSYNYRKRKGIGININLRKKFTVILK